MPGQSASTTSLDALGRRVESDETAFGLILTGSRARSGMATSHSDTDVFVIYGDGTKVAWHELEIAGLDIGTYRLETFRRPALLTEDPERWWNRYALAHSQVLIDKLGGKIREYAQAQATLSPEEAAVVVPDALDGYINLAMRSLKSARDGRLLESRLDAAESLGYALLTIYSLEGRIRPYNKYLPWDLANFPLENPEFEAGRLLELVSGISSESDAESQRALFVLIETVARKRGHGDVIDSWEHDLRVFD